MTVRELCVRMDSQELAEWIAYTRYFHALPDSWAETSLIVSAAMAPHCKEGQVPKPTTFVPTIPPPKHHSQDYAELVRLQAALNGNG
jgi:hypothetical protein